MKWWRVFKKDKEAKRRAAERFAFSVPLSARCSSWPKYVDLFTGDISRTGLFVPTDHRATVGETVEIELTVPDGRTVTLKGSVVRIVDEETAAAHGKGAGLGIQLSEPEGEARDIYQELLGAMHERQPRPATEMQGEPAAPPPPTEALPLDEDDVLEIDDSALIDFDEVEAEELSEIEQPPPPQTAPAVHTGPSDVIIGVDLGTTFTSVAAAVNNKVTILAREDGSRSSPSVISFPSEQDILLGSAARERIASDPGHTITSPKRLLGRPYHENEVQSMLGQAPFRSYAGPDGTTIIEMWGSPYAIPQLCALLLKDARELAEKQLDTRIDKAVISVPISFDSNRLGYLKKTAQMAGLELVAVVDEPSAAALSNRYDPNFGGVVGVYDFGGGTFDFSVVDVSAGDFRVLATAGDTWLGGDDFDNVLAEAAANQFWRKHKVDLRTQALEWQRLLFACEKAKRVLSTAPHALIHVENVLRTADGMVNLRLSLDRGTLERAVAPIIKQSLDTCDEALGHLGITPTDLSAIYLSGGTTYMPCIRQSLTQHFQVPVRTGVPPEHAVCLGAAIHAAQIQYRKVQTLETR